MKTKLDPEQTAHTNTHPAVRPASPTVIGEVEGGLISFSSNTDICFIKGQILKPVKLKARLSVWPEPKSTELL